MLLKICLISLKEMQFVYGTDAGNYMNVKNILPDSLPNKPFLTVNIQHKYIVKLEV